MKTYKLYFEKFQFQCIPLNSVSIYACNYNFNLIAWNNWNSFMIYVLKCLEKFVF